MNIEAQNERYNAYMTGKTFDDQHPDPEVRCIGCDSDLMPEDIVPDPDGGNMCRFCGWRI